MTPPASTLSIIASGMQVTGDIRCNGVLRIDGILDGSILGARQLLVTPGGRVRGDVQADEIVVGGEIEGNVRASVRLELQGSAVVNGNIETRAFVVPEGGRVNGDIRMIVGEGTRVEPLLLQAPPPALPALTASAEPPIAVAVAPAPAAPSPRYPSRLWRQSLRYQRQNGRRPTPSKPGQRQSRTAVFLKRSRERWASLKETNSRRPSSPNGRLRSGPPNRSARRNARD